MGVRITTVLTIQQRHDMNEAAVARGWYRDDRRVFLPGMAWYQHFYFDPTREWEAWRAAQPDPDKYCREPVIKRPANPDDRAGFLSPHYWRDWSHKRPPICVVCPNGEQWEVDRWSSNGTGWTVTGDLPNITCSPSIVVPGYHGFLKNGEFTGDIEGRGPTGTMRAM